MKYPALLGRHCDLCGQLQDEVFAFAEHDEGVQWIRQGWLCTKCWPAEGSWHKAILRERIVSKHDNREVGSDYYRTDVSGTNDLPRSTGRTS